jgi:hypothetical protein
MTDRFFRPVLLLLVLTTFLAPGCQRRLTPAEDWHAFQMALGRTTADMIQFTEGFEQLDRARSNAESVTLIQGKILPAIDRSLQELDKVHPQTAEVRQFRDQYVDCFQKARALLVKLQTASSQPLSQGTRTMNEGVQMARNFGKDLERLEALSNSLNQRYGRAVVNAP